LSKYNAAINNDNDSTNELSRQFKVVLIGGIGIVRTRANEQGSISLDNVGATYNTFRFLQAQVTAKWHMGLSNHLAADFEPIPMNERIKQGARLMGDSIGDHYENDSTFYVDLSKIQCSDPITTTDSTNELVDSLKVGPTAYLNCTKQGPK